MANQQVKVKALRAFSHGNVDAKKDRVYLMNSGDAKELEKLGFLSLGATGEPDAAQALMPAAKPQPGDVVADDDADILGAKMETAVDNKMAKTGAHKTAKN